MSKKTELEQQLVEWEKKFEVFEIPIEDKIGYLRAPDMTDYKRALSAMQRNGDVAFGEEMLSALWLGGDEEILNEDAYFLPARLILLDFLNYEDPEIEKLKGGKTKITIGKASCVVRVVTRDDIKISEKKNPGRKPFVSQESLFNAIVQEKDAAFDDRKDASIRFPLYKAIDEMQNQKVGLLKKRSPRPS